MSATLAFLGEFGDAIDFIFNSRESQAGGAQVGGCELLPLLWTHLKLTAAGDGDRDRRSRCRSGSCSATPAAARSLTISVSNVGRAVPSLALIAFFVAFFPAHAGVLERHPRARPARDPADPHQRLRRRPPGRPRRGRRRARHGDVRRPDRPLGRAPARPAADLRRHQDLDRQRHRHRHDRAAGRRAHARRPDHLRHASTAARARSARRSSSPRWRWPPSSGLSAVQRAVTPTGVKLERGASARVPPRNPQEEDPDRPMKPTRLLLALLLIALSRVRRRRLRRRRGGARRHAAPSRVRRRAARSSATTPTPRSQLTIGSKNFTEQKVLGEIYAQGLEAAGFTVSKDLNLGDEQTALAAAQGRRDRRLPGVHRHGAARRSSARGRRAAEGPAGRLRGGQGGLRGRGPRRAAADAVHLLQRGRGHAGDGRRARAEDDLRPRGQVAGPRRSTARPSAASGSTACSASQQVYGLKFKKFVPVDVAQRHEVLTSGRADVSIVFTTDPQIKRENEVLLEDDKGMFPPYNSTLVMKQETADAGGENLHEDGRADPGAADRREHAGAQRPRGPRQEGSRRRSPRST